MSRPAELTLSRTDDALRAVMPPGRNPYYIVGALLFGIPWLVGVAIGLVLAIRAVSSSQAGFVWIAALLGTIALTALLDVLAVALIWLSFYSALGRETLEVTGSEIAVRRRALGLSTHAHAKRGHFDRAVLLDPRRSPGRVPHPRVEISGAFSRLRVGAGLSPHDAETLVTALREFLRDVGPDQGL